MLISLTINHQRAAHIRFNESILRFANADDDLHGYCLQNQERLGLTDIVKPGGLLYFHVHEPRIKFEKLVQN